MGLAERKDKRPIYGPDPNNLNWKNGKYIVICV